MLGIRGRSKCFTINFVNASTDFKGFEVDLTVEALDQSGRLNVKNAWSVPKLPIFVNGMACSNDVKKGPTTKASNYPLPSYLA